MKDTTLMMEKVKSTQKMNSTIARMFLAELDRDIEIKKTNGTYYAVRWNQVFNGDEILGSGNSLRYCLLGMPSLLEEVKPFEFKGALVSSYDENRGVVNIHHNGLIYSDYFTGVQRPGIDGFEVGKTYDIRGLVYGRRIRVSRYAEVEVEEKTDEITKGDDGVAHVFRFVTHDDKIRYSVALSDPSRDNHMMIHCDNAKAAHALVSLLSDPAYMIKTVPMVTGGDGF